MLNQLRTTIPANARATWYAVAGALVAALIAWGMLDSTAGAAVTGVTTAVVTLAFAVLHSTSPWRQAVYGLAAACTVLAVYLGYGSPEQWDAILAVIAPVLGIGIAGATTNTDEYVGEHRAEG